MSFRLIVFDLDGTLVDSLRDLSESANALLVECGGRAHSQEAIGRMVGDGAATLVARSFSAANLAPPPHALARFLATYNARVVRFTRPYPGVPEALEALASRSALAVLTNKPIGATREILDALDLARFFSADRILGGDGPHLRKPDPGGLLELASRVGVPVDDTVLVGDSVIDWRTARAAGAAACLVRYGFGFEGVPIAELDTRDMVIDSPRELASRL